MIDRRPRDRRGFSLIEVVVCLGLLTIGLMATLAMNVSATRLQQTSQVSTKATALMHDLLEQYRGIGSAGIQAHLGTPIPASPGNRLGEYVIDTSSGNTWGNFKIIDALDVRGNATDTSGRDVTTALAEATVVVTILPEYHATDPCVNSVLPMDLDGNGAFGEVPADVPNLDGQDPADPNTSIIGDYSVIPIQVRITYRQPVLLKQDGSTVPTITLTAATMIYPSSSN